MPGITSVIEALITASFIDKRALLPRASKTEWFLLIFAVLCAGMGLFFLALALYQYLEGLYAPRIAALIASALVLAVAALAMGLRQFLRFKKSSDQDDFSENIHALITAICSELEDPIRENPKTSVAIAALAGLLAARHI